MEDLGELDLWVGRELDRLADRVDEPAEDDLAGPSATVALKELLQGHGLVPALRGHIRASQDLVNGVQQVLPESLEAAVPTLSELDEVVDEHIGVAQGLLEAPVGRRCQLFRGGRQVGWRVGLRSARQGEVPKRVVFRARTRLQAG